MKKLFLVSALLALPLVGCNSGTTAPDNSNNPVVTDPQPTPQPNPQPAPTGNPGDWQALRTNPIATMSSQYTNLLLSHCVRKDAATGEVRCYFRTTSNSDRSLYIGGSDTYLVDSAGNEYDDTAIKSTISTGPTKPGDEFKVRANTEYFWYIDFNYSKSETTIKYLNLRMYDYNEYESRFENVPIIAGDGKGSAPVNTPKVDEWQAVKTQPIGSFRTYNNNITLSHCIRKDVISGEVRCFLTTRSNRDTNIYIGGSGTYLVDSKGNEYNDMFLKRTTDKYAYTPGSGTKVVNGIDNYWYLDFNYNKDEKVIKYLNIRVDDYNDYTERFANVPIL